MTAKLKKQPTDIKIPSSIQAKGKEMKKALKIMKPVAKKGQSISGLSTGKSAKDVTKDLF